MRSWQLQGRSWGRWPPQPPTQVGSGRQDGSPCTSHLEEATPTQGLSCGAAAFPGRWGCWGLVACSASEASLLGRAAPGGSQTFPRSVRPGGDWGQRFMTTAGGWGGQALRPSPQGTGETRPGRRCRTAPLAPLVLSEPGLCVQGEERPFAHPDGAAETWQRGVLLAPWFPWL